MIKQFFSASLVLAIFFILVANPVFAKEPEPGRGGSGELERHGVSETLGGKGGRTLVTPSTMTPAISTPPPVAQETRNSMTKLKDQVARLNDQIGVASASVAQLKANADSINKQIAELSAQLGIAQPQKDQH